MQNYSQQFEEYYKQGLIFKDYNYKELLDLYLQNNQWKTFLSTFHTSLNIDALRDNYNSQEIISINNIYKYSSLYLFYNQRQFQAIELLEDLYEKQNEKQVDDSRIHKGLPLYYIFGHYFNIGYRSIAKRYLMLAFIEDIISIHTSHSVNNAEDYKSSEYSLRNEYGMPQDKISKYEDAIKKLYDKIIADSNKKQFILYPEYFLQELDKDWMLEYPSPMELDIYKINKEYYKVLYNIIVGNNDGDGKIYELLCEYCLLSIPGFRTQKNMRTETTEYDVFCSISGEFFDFRKDFGTYLIAECKNWKAPSDITVISKLLYFINQTKCNCGIIFSRNGITGDDTNGENYASRELLKAYHRTGIYIFVLNLGDFKSIGDGENILSILRNQYEENRFDFKNKTE